MNQDISQKFANTLLITTANYGYIDVLKNWAVMSHGLGLKFLVVAMDDMILNELRSLEQSHPYLFKHVIPSTFKVNTNSSGFGTHEFNLISCNKFQVVLQTMECCYVDVVFSDTDNVLLHDPFQHNMGQMIASQQFDYLYQSNVYPKASKKNAGVIWDTSSGQTIPSAANTGFYYLSNTATSIKRIMQETVDECWDTPEFDEQHYFWQAMTEARVNQTITQPLSHCTGPTVRSILAKFAVNAVATEVPPKPTHNWTRLCPLDPFYHPTGWTTPRPDAGWITYHANYVKGKSNKIDVLKKVNGWVLDHLPTIKASQSAALE